MYLQNAPAIYCDARIQHRSEEASPARLPPCGSAVSWGLAVMRIQPGEGKQQRNMQSRRYAPQVGVREWLECDEGGGGGGRSQRRCQ